MNKKFYCPKCDEEVAENEALCPNCGFSFVDEDEDVRCTNCNEIIDIDAAYCQHCGASFGEVEEVEEEIVKHFDEGTKFKKAALEYAKEIEEEKEVNKIVDAMYLIGKINLWVVIIYATIMLIYSFVLMGEDAGGGFILLIISILLYFSAYLAPMIFYWLANMLKFTYRISKKR